MMLRNAARVRIRRDVDLEPYTILQAGELGTVVHTYNDAQGVWGVDVRMDKRHPGLAEWNNEAHLVDPELGALEPVSSYLGLLSSLAATVAALVWKGGLWWTAS